jgi:hypothetical protein
VTSRQARVAALLSLVCGVAGFAVTASLIRSAGDGSGAAATADGLASRRGRGPDREAAHLPVPANRRSARQPEARPVAMTNLPGDTDCEAKLDEVSEQTAARTPFSTKGDMTAYFNKNLPAAKATLGLLREQIHAEANAARECFARGGGSPQSVRVALEYHVSSDPARGLTAHGGRVVSLQSQGAVDEQLARRCSETVASKTYRLEPPGSEKPWLAYEGVLPWFINL